MMKAVDTSWRSRSYIHTLFIFDAIHHANRRHSYFRRRIRLGLPSTGDWKFLLQCSCSLNCTEASLLWLNSKVNLTVSYLSVCTTASYPCNVEHVAVYLTFPYRASTPHIKDETGFSLEATEGLCQDALPVCAWSFFIGEIWRNLEKHRLLFLDFKQFETFLNIHIQIPYRRDPQKMPADISSHKLPMNHSMDRSRVQKNKLPICSR
ncbi:uncharacterized protein C8R40DRAFT_13465 [Lentinula edodes]|uniref:uncharacterized protein n=1 Tax=Lentinula edodes TaxID=5353 RepID=UPI001E8D251D|nr:uncharacterized protein C8R40DRAFT_13465 [Lentinula edodes]KAH7881038.1 hypothetical protein C8R40DRAFT_13465 [Lentinula edodes]